MSDAHIKIDSSAAEAAALSPLHVTLGREISRQRPNCSLLLGFHFGAAQKVDQQPAIISPRLMPIDGGDVYECWWYEGEVTLRTHGSVAIAECEDFAVATLQWPDVPAGRCRTLTFDAYTELLQALRSTRHHRLVRVWSYFGDINEGAGEAEKYRQFSAGRARAFDEFGIRDDALPAATVIGTIGDSPYSIIALASRHDVRSVENPRQVSAFRYPRRYGHKSPRFSRGASMAVGTRRLFFISGTAAIVGHESAHPQQTGLQLDETLVNLETLCDAMSGADARTDRFVLDRDSTVRVYVRSPQDLEVVTARLSDYLGSIDDNVVFLHADICRRELMVEIEGVGIT